MIPRGGADPPPSRRRSAWPRGLAPCAGRHGARRAREDRSANGATLAGPGALSAAAPGRPPDPNASASPGSSRPDAAFAGGVVALGLVAVLLEAAHEGSSSRAEPRGGSRYRAGSAGGCSERRTRGAWSGTPGAARNLAFRPGIAEARPMGVGVRQRMRAPTHPLRAGPRRIPRAQRPTPRAPPSILAARLEAPAP